MGTQSPAAVAVEMADSCLMMRARLVARAVTAIYDEELRPFGVQASQLNLLTFVALAGPIRRSDLGRSLHLDSSTLTRNLRVMAANGWIEEVKHGSDGRGLPVRVSRKGEALIAKVAPAWRSAQRQAGTLLGVDGSDSLMQVAGELLGAGA
jgi:DNA-binding MarR family transcriptional regulator